MLVPACFSLQFQLILDLKIAPPPAAFNKLKTYCSYFMCALIVCFCSLFFPSF